jgi:thiamine-phosphate pyrophosphorylase
VILPPENPEQTQRIVDASLDRIGEGLRLLEDVVRFILNDTSLTQKLKEMRHGLVVSEPSFNWRLIQARHAETDIGADIEIPLQTKEKDLPSLVVANARRVQESLRVLEELAKLPASRLNTAHYRKARFKLYTLERKLLSRLLRCDKTEHISGFYAIVDTGVLGQFSHLEAAKALIDGGASIIQFRDKTSSRRKSFDIACQLKELCAKKGVLFIVNDYLDIALAVDADGLHIGQDDLPVAEARRLLPIDKLLGCSVTNAKEATEVERDGADYIAAGAVFATVSKEDIEVIGLGELKKIRMATRLPLVAIGGITRANCSDVLGIGTDAVAVISAVFGAKKPKEAARQMAAAIEDYRKTVKVRANIN